MDYQKDGDELEGAAEIVKNDAPLLENVCEDYRSTLRDFDHYTNLQNRNWAARNCKWPGQTPDQRKRSRVVNGTRRMPFPWEGASDLKIPVVDEIIIDAVALDHVGLRGANIRAQPVGQDDLEKATLATHFMRWLMQSEMREFYDEAELLSQTRHTGGLSILKVYWSEHVQRVPMEVTLEQMAQQFPQIVPAIQAGTLDDALEGLLVQIFSQAQIPVTKKRAKQMLEDFREKGTTTIPTVESVEKRPKVKALTPGIDIFFPVNTSDLQEATAIYERVWMTPSQSREMVYSDGWDEEYVEHCCERCVNEGGEDFLNTDERFETERMGYGSSTQPGVRSGLIEWIYAYQKRSDDNGIPGVYLTVFCPVAKQDDGKGSEDFAKRELVNYRHGKYPFVPFKRERLSRCLLDSRGVPEVGEGWQNAIKVEMDSRIDNASQATCPPRYHPPGREPADRSPGSSVPARAGRAEYGFLEAPPFPNHSIEVQQSLQKMVRQYFGRMTDATDQSEATKKQQKQLNDYLWPFRDVMEMVWALYYQFGPEEEFFRVIGVTSEQAQKFAKSDYGAKYSFWFAFDVQEMDPETIVNGLEKLGPIMAQWDANAQLNKEEVLRMFVSRVFGPVAADRLILPKETASDKEIKETQLDIAKMAAGVDVDPPMNAASELRMQTVQQWMQGSKDNPATDVQQRMQSDEALKKRIEKYTKQLQFQTQQRQNAQIGRQGAAPAYS